MISFAPIVRARRPIIATYAVLAALAAPGLLRLQLDNSPAGFFVRDDAAREAFERMESDFGRDRGVRIVVQGDGLWTRAGLDALAALEGGLSTADGGLGGVYAAAGPWRHHRWHLPEWPPADPQAFRNLLMADAVDRDTGWVSRDGRAASVLVGLFRLSPQLRARTLEGIDERLATLRGSSGGSIGGSGGISTYAVGLPVVSYTVDRAQGWVIRVALPLLVLVAALLSSLLFRSLYGVLLPLCLVAVTQVVLFGLLGYAGQRIDFITLLLVPLTFVIALATGVHVLAYYRRRLHAGEAGEVALLQTFRVKAWPVLWTGITTAAGFASLALSGVPSVRALGSWTAFGVLFMTLAALSLYPALMASAAGGPAAPTSLDLRLAGALRRVVATAVQRPRAVYALFAAIGVLAAMGLPRLQVDTSVLSYFAPEHPLRRDLARLDELGIPAVSASLVIEAPAAAARFDEPAALRRLGVLANELRAEPLVLGAVSAGDLVANVAAYPEAEAAAADRGAGDRSSAQTEAATDRRAGDRSGAQTETVTERGTGVPIGAQWAASDGALARARDRMRDVPDLAELLGAVLVESAERTRIVLFTPMRGYTELEPIFERAIDAAQRAFPGAGVQLTGEYPLVLAAQRSLLATMVLSLAATFIVIAAAFGGLLGSIGLAARSLLPNLWPVLLVLGAMGWLGIPLDSTTVMVAAIVLGLAVDDTLHTLGHLRLHEAAGSAPEHRDVIASSMVEVAGGHVMTSLILCLGFLVPTLSELMPVARFGMLSALAVAAALAADLLLVPAVLAGASAESLARLRGRR